MFNKSYDREKTELTIMYVQEQLQVAVASLMNKAEKYKFLNLAYNTLIDDVKSFYNAHKDECVKNTGIQDVLDSLNYGIFGEVQVDCTVACSCIDIIEKFEKEHGIEFDINFNLNQFHTNNDLARVMPLGYESRLTEDEVARKDDFWEVIKPGLRFVDVRTPKTKYFNLFGKLEDAQKTMKYAYKGKEFNLDNPSDEELNVIRNLDDYIYLYETLTYKHPNSKKYNFAKNIDEALAYLGMQVESDYEIFFENIGKADELEDIKNDENNSIELDDESIEKIVEGVNDEDLIIDYADEPEDDDNCGLIYTNIQSHLEDIWIFNNILKKMCAENLGENCEFCTTKKLCELCDAVMGKLTEHGLDFERYEGLKDYEESQKLDIEYYLEDLMEDEGLKRDINGFYINYCDYNYYQHSEGGNVYLN